MARLREGGASRGGRRPLTSLEEFQRLFDEGAIDGVAVVAADANACATCAAAADRVYAPSKLPPLPIARCSAPGGCRCHYEPSITVVE